MIYPCECLFCKSKEYKCAKGGGLESAKIFAENPWNNLKNLLSPTESFSNYYNRKVMIIEREKVTIISTLYDFIIALTFSCQYTTT